MIDTLVNLLFRCPHRRLTRPITPMSKPGVPHDDTYVVCLDCGKQFAYDWKEMRMGGPVRSSPTSGVLHPDMPKPRNLKLEYALLGSAIPLAVLVGKALRSKRRQPSKANKDEPAGKPAQAPSESTSG